MTFQEILKHLNDGEKVRRPVWDKKEYVNFNWCDRLAFSNSERCPLTKEDYMADDWEVYDDRKYFDFNKAYKLMKEGKKVLRKALEPEEKVSCYIFLEDGCFLGGINRTYYFYKLKQDDIEAKDWFVVEEEN